MSEKHARQGRNTSKETLEINPNRGKLTQGAIRYTVPRIS